MNWIEILESSVNYIWGIKFEQQCQLVSLRRPSASIIHVDWHLRTMRCNEWKAGVQKVLSKIITVVQANVCTRLCLHKLFESFWQLTYRIGEVLKCSKYDYKVCGSIINLLVRKTFIVKKMEVILKLYLSSLDHSMTIL